MSGRKPHFRNLKDLTDNLTSKHISKLVQAMGLPQVSKILGNGAFGQAYKLANGKVLKLTINDSDYKFAKDFLNVHEKHLVHFYDAKIVNFNGKVFYAIVMEYINDFKSLGIIDDFINDTYACMIYNTTGYKQLSDDLSEAIQYYLDPTRVYADLDKTYESIINVVEKNKQVFNIVAQLPDLRKFLVKHHKTLVDFYDLNPYNFGLRKDGTLVLIDQMGNNSSGAEHGSIDLTEIKVLRPEDYIQFTPKGKTLFLKLLNSRHPVSILQILKYNNESIHYFIEFLDYIKAGLYKLDGLNITRSIDINDPEAVSLNNYELKALKLFKTDKLIY